jgi:8-oxo-dGTP diphosphatase
LTEATLCYIRDAGSVLLQRRPRGKLGASRLNGPGGKLDPGESAVEAVTREILEETGLHIAGPRPHGGLDFVFGKPEAFRLRVHIFSTDAYRGALRPTEGELEWHDVQRLPFDEMWPDNRYWVPFVLDGGVVSGECVFDEQGDGLLEMAVSLRMNGRAG